MDLLTTIRFVHFTATALTAGTIFFAVLVPAQVTALERRLSMLAGSALTIAVLSGVAWLWVQAADILDVSLTDVGLQGHWTVLAETRFGQVMAARLALAASLAALLSWRLSQPLQTLAAGAMTILPALTGHAGAVSGAIGYGLLAADMVHLLAAAAWLGALPAFALFLATSGRDDIVVQATRRYATIATICVLILLASGIVSTWHQLNGLRDLIDTDYGRLLSAKLVLFSAMLAAAAVNRFRLTPHLPVRSARRALIRNSLAETALGLGVLLIVAALGTMAPSRHVHRTNDVIPDEASFVHIHDSRAMADVVIDPGRSGRANITIRVSREDFSEFPARAVRVALDPPPSGGRPVDLAALRQSDGSWHTAPTMLSHDGKWTVRVTVSPAAGPAFVLDAPIVIGR